MAVALDREDHNKIVEVLSALPAFFMAQGRQATLLAAFTGYPNAPRMLGNMTFDSPVNIFVVQMVNHLTVFGQLEKDVETLGVLLNYIADPKYALVGQEDRAFLHKMIIAYQMLPDIPTKEVLAAEKPDRNGNESSEAGNGMVADDCYIFISYARPNVNVANSIAEGLEAAGYNFFQDIRAIESGDMWSQRIEEGLRKAGRMVLLLSKASMPFRKEVEREWFFFDMKGKPIHTVLVEDCDINSRLIQVNYIDARTHVDNAVQQLITKLDTECKKT